MLPRGAILGAGVVFGVLDLLVTVGHWSNIRAEDPKTVRIFHYRFSRIGLVGSFFHAILCVDPTGTLGFLNNFVNLLLWLTQYLVLGAFVSTWLVLWMQSLLKIIVSELESEIRMLKMTKVQIGYLAVLAAIFLVWIIVDQVGTAVQATVMFIVLNSYVALSGILFVIYTVNLVAKAIKEIRRSGSTPLARSAIKSGEEASKIYATQIKSLVIRTFIIVATFLILVPILILLNLDATKTITEGRAKHINDSREDFSTAVLVAAGCGTLAYVGFLLFASKLSFKNLRALIPVSRSGKDYITATAPEKLGALSQVSVEGTKPQSQVEGTKAEAVVVRTSIPDQ